MVNQSLTISIHFRYFQLGAAMTLIDIKEILQSQQNDKTKGRRRFLRNFAIVAGISGLVFLLERSFHFHELLHRWIETGYYVSADTVILLIVITLFSFLVVSNFDLRKEMRRRRQAEAQAISLAYHDPLTKLGNRRKFEEYMAELKPGHTYAVMMLDLDDFKPVNDIFGHAVGDEILVQAATRLASVCGRDGQVARFGGDEFAIIAGPIEVTEEADLLARAIQIAFDQTFEAGTFESRLSVSIGMTFHEPGLAPPENALREADLALYRAKEDKRNPYCLFERSIEDELRRSKLLEKKLRNAMALHAVKPNYQPLVNLRTNEVIGFEALARWTDPEFGEVQPSEFIAIAEESGLILELNDYLLRAACRDAVQWPNYLKLSFNLSAKQFRDKLVGLRIIGILGETGLPAHRLEMEITESCLAEDMDQAREALASLRNAGVRIAIDDFGTGYSSLYHLREFHFDNLKIDRSFIDAMNTNADDTVIVNSILGLARGLGLRTTAEGIEHEAQLSSLLSSGCEQGQGYLFGKAMPQKEVMRLIDQGSSEALSA
jgi:diguanylate cyclase (GGDEF)-like protein